MCLKIRCDGYCMKFFENINKAFDDGNCRQCQKANNPCSSVPLAIWSGACQMAKNPRSCLCLHVVMAKMGNCPNNYGPHKRTLAHKWIGLSFNRPRQLQPECPESPIHNLPDLDGDYHVHTVAKAASSHDKPATDLWVHSPANSDAGVRVRVVVSSPPNKKRAVPVGGLATVCRPVHPRVQTAAARPTRQQKRPLQSRLRPHAQNPSPSLHSPRPKP